MARKGQVVHVRGAGGEGPWWFFNSATSFTTTVGDYYMLFGQIDSYSFDSGSGIVTVFSGADDLRRILVLESGSLTITPIVEGLNGLHKIAGTVTQTY
jgi:hypothetical protein